VEIPIIKFQIPNKSQSPMTKNLGNWNLAIDDYLVIDVWCLVIAIRSIVMARGYA
jgi:hypothetical protein